MCFGTRHSTKVKFPVEIGFQFSGPVPRFVVQHPFVLPYPGEEMMGKLSQAQFIAALRTPLGGDVLVLKRFSGTEGLGELFEFQVEALSEQENIDFDQALGQSCTIKLKTYSSKERFFCGVLTTAQWVGAEVGGEQDYSHYRLVLRPWFWLLAHRADCRIFLDKDVKEIIQDVFEKAGFARGTDFQFNTTGNYDKIKYCVQYRESDFAFVSRLMEQYGIYYFFEHKDGLHTMILADSRSSHSPIPDLPSVQYHSQTAAYKRVEQQIHSWTSDRRFRTGKIEFNDYDYLKPPKQLRAPKEASEKYTHSKFEVYDYPGKYDEQDKGKQFAQFRLEAEQAIDHRRMGDGDAPSLFAGGLVTVEKHPTSTENKEYLVVRASHMFGTQSYGTVSTESAVGYHGTYELIPSDRPFRSLPLTPKPRIFGIQTAKVVCKKGEDSEEISTDENGHIWVQFYWDREPQKSCPIRVAQVWASKQWGGQFIPRIGMEVVVEFLEGDPDRPLVTGCVYNGDNKVPYDLPGQKTQSGTKSDSSKGHNGYNEFMFEDKKDNEFIRMHAEKDHLVTIKANQTGTVGVEGPDSGNQTWTVDGNRSWTIQKGNDTLEIQMGNQTITLDMGQQTVETMQGITLNVCFGISSIAITPASITLMSPSISLVAETEISLTAPVINLTGVVNIAGALTVDGMTPMLLPA
jgi:type VI secretion system secreted protein VgrG